eukprot:TRINITY_DN370_c0_g2_i13.p1 TRINITY_DN370_c0_g2~~TRINITY_DN370_c0_g2_i13.p1  ORF type:complete len:199 (+),score=7.22 TRINITY_DN370_c0_g2_i13:2-598(+)
MGAHRLTSILGVPAAIAYSIYGKFAGPEAGGDAAGGGPAAASAADADASLSQCPGSEGAAGATRRRSHDPQVVVDFVSRTYPAKAADLLRKLEGMTPAAVLRDGVGELVKGGLSWGAAFSVVAFAERVVRTERLVSDAKRRRVAEEPAISRDSSVADVKAYIDRIVPGLGGPGGSRSHCIFHLRQVRRSSPQYPRLFL